MGSGRGGGLEVVYFCSLGCFLFMDEGREFEESGVYIDRLFWVMRKSRGEKAIEFGVAFRVYRRLIS